MSAFLQALQSGRVLLMDGAMGTELRRLGLGDAEHGELWNLRHPDRVAGVHRAYTEAGARVLLTNTFQIVRVSIGWRSRSPFSGSRFEEREALAALQWAAAALARSACGADGFVLADVGSFTTEPSADEFADLSLLRLAVLRVGPVDGLLLETCSTPRVRLAVGAAVKLRPDLPVLLSLTFRHNHGAEIETLSGHAPAWFARRARGFGASALGVNCGRDLDMDDVIQVVRQYRDHTDLPLFARPNAGSPRRRGERWVYPLTPTRMAARLPELLDAGVRMVGGCCGTTPAHIAAFRPIVARWNTRLGRSAQEDKS